jgi:CxxC motif-containing protein (DUF1111 family)
LPCRRPDSFALALVLLAALIPRGPAAELSGAQLTGRAEFTDRRDPPRRHVLDKSTQEVFDLGLLVFNTPWVTAGTPNAARRDGLGPLFVSTSCDACHNNGARGRPPARNDGLSNSFVMQLGGASPYGAVLNTAAVPDHNAEGQIEVSRKDIAGRYADGASWTLREPTYRLRRLIYGELPAETVLRPRIASSVFGAGLIESVSQTALREIRRRQSASMRGELPVGRFGWQAEAISIEDQTARALAREMGITSRPRMADDCTAIQIACRNGADGGKPEASDEFLHALVTLQEEIAVPSRKALGAQQEKAGSELFTRTGCGGCHISRLPVETDIGAATIDAYTDLLVHDMGPQLADRNASGQSVTSHWRTAPLWGLAHALNNEAIALLHDGRASSVEEAILWHGGQAGAARAAFIAMPLEQRQLLITWVGSL